MNLVRNVRKNWISETGARLWHKPLAACVFLFSLGAIAGSATLSVSACRRISDSTLLESLIGPLGGLGFAMIGLTIIFAKPAHAVGWLCLISGFGLPFGGGLDSLLDCALGGQFSLPALAWLAWISYVMLPWLVVVPFFILLPMLFPSGTFLTPGWRNFAYLLLAIMALATLAVAITPDFSSGNGFGIGYPLDNPLGVSWLPSWWGAYAANGYQLLTILCSLCGIVVMIFRLKRSRGDERQQMKLFSFWTIAVIVQLIAFELILSRIVPYIEGTAWYDRVEIAYQLILLLVFLGFPVIVGFAIFRYRLYEIDLLINRTLVYGGLSIIIVLAYVLVVGGLGAVFQARGNLLISLLATGLIAVLFQPVRERLQRGVNRLMFGERDNPYAVLSGLVATLQSTAAPQAMLQTVVDTIAAALKLPYVAVELGDEDERLGGAETGNPVGEAVKLPLRYQNEVVGKLLVSPRSPGESFGGRERALLADLAAQTGAMAASVRLMAALQRSREKLVQAREEERRRIRRDLHDGLGPTLASQTFTLDAVLDHLETDPLEAARLLRGLKSQNQKTVAEIRRLVYELRPPALDELGLPGALRAKFAQLNNTPALQIRIASAPDPLPALSAAVEVAAYRIALEAITNVVRHANARCCELNFQVVENSRPWLRIQVSDDGGGLPPELNPGVGLISMRERAEELGGSFRITSSEHGGTAITVLLPFSMETELGRES